ncbi:MAG: hypothetical protein U5K43_09680 [Halofilum sp. (in: g-proteobacteria)]|nr:hypothetical protein [Halofilum sp. (in: g-proteobacteria)]
MFLQLTSLGRVPEMKRLLHAPFTLHSGLLECASQGERDRAARWRGRTHHRDRSTPWWSRGSSRRCTTPRAAAVEIDLIVRGMCCLRPGVPRRRSASACARWSGCFLEPRADRYCFGAGDQPQVWLSSADWTGAQLLHARVETCFPVENRRLQRPAGSTSWRAYLADNTPGLAARPATGATTRALPGHRRGAPFGVQQALLARAARGQG